MKCNFLLATTLFIATALWTTPTVAQQKTESKKPEMNGSLDVTTDTNDGNGETNINYKEDGHRYKIKVKGTKILEMSLDGLSVPSDEYSTYEPLVKKILVQIEHDREQARKDQEQATKDREQAERGRRQAERDREQAGKDREQAEEERQNLNSHRQRMDKERAQAEEDRKQAERDREQARKDRAQAELDHAQAVKDRKQAEEDRKLFEGMLDELVNEKVVESHEAVTSLELDDTQLTINGRVQPETLHSRFKSKYLKGTHRRITYRNSEGSRNMTVN